VVTTVAVKKKTLSARGKRNEETDSERERKGFVRENLGRRLSGETSATAESAGSVKRKGERLGRRGV